MRKDLDYFIKHLQELQIQVSSFSIPDSTIEAQFDNIFNTLELMKDAQLFILKEISIQKELRRLNNVFKV